MVIEVLVENRTSSPDLSCEHGLSLYIETQKHKILFDMGGSTIFLDNASKMGVDLSLVDIGILSHGHSDHGGGLPVFLDFNKKASIYIHEKAGEKHYARREDAKIAEIGILPQVMKAPKVICTRGDWQVDDGILLFSTVDKKQLCSKANDVLLCKKDAGYVKDPFEHEQNLLLTENGKNILVTGCAHRGIVNIMARAMELAGGPLDVVLGGFHLSIPSTGKCEADDIINGVAEYLNSYETKYYTFHCTGIEAYKKLKLVLGDKISYLETGNKLEL
ncbi:MAG: MBL fold metallo-hydrolase [Acidaminococcaceae bacterium]|nr:MBL fold metallo-hydrolase [Acidaminococcaceae bacterium]MDD4722296.1 MBL fold metallo-hydrolase [Acidaminococcaceae bacterium]